MNKIDRSVKDRIENSPYQSFSTFAGNPYFISLEALVEEGVLTKAECEAVGERYLSDRGRCIQRQKPVDLPY